MSWAQGRNHRGEVIGYAIEAVCDDPCCGEEIDKGLAYCCGGLDGISGAAGCGGYFCQSHLWYGPAGAGQRCRDCLTVS